MWYGVSLTGRRYNVRLHQGSARGACREPELRSTRVELDQAHRVIKGKSDQQNQEILLQLADLENELREETSLTSFITGFPLGMGITGEIEPF